MGQGQSTRRAPVNDTGELEAQIEQTRQELGDTVAELAARTDVKARAHARIEQTKASVAQKRDQLLSATPPTARAAAVLGTQQVKLNPTLAVAAGAFLAGLLVGRLISH